MEKIDLAGVGAFLKSIVTSFRNRFDKSPIATTEVLSSFVQTRSAYVAQTALYGYLKTRMGTRFREYFEDDVFSQSIRIAAVKLFASCLADFCIYAAAEAARDGRLSPDEAAGLARHCFDHGLTQGLVDSDREHVPADVWATFRARASTTAWSDAVRGESAFSGSADDLVRFAPVVDEFKALDREIVTNSIRFRWQPVRETFRRRLDRDAIAQDWRSRGALP